jgi:4-amino-4-deoxy-L-arabinose transferase-like glycosyltransferase
MRIRPKLSAPVLFGVLLTAGVLFKAFYLWSYSETNPHFSLPRLDSAIYVDWAREINRDGWLGKEVFYQAPLYPYLLSILFRLFGDEGFLSVYVMQLLMGAGIPALVFLTARRVYNERAALVSAVLCLSYAPFTFYETKILTTVTEMFLAALFMYLLVRAEQERKRRWWIAGGAAHGLAIICRPNYLPVVPLMLAAILLRRRKNLRDELTPMLAVSLAPALIIGVVAVRNYVVGKDFVPISSSAGVTFAQGNNAMARGGLVVLPGFSGSAARQREEEMQIAGRETGKPLKPSEASAFWFRRTFDFIKDHPMEYLKLLCNKTLLICNNRELGNNYLLSIDTALSPCLRLACMPFGLIMALAVPGVFITFREKPSSSIIIATFLGSVLMLLLFYVATRYRMTMAPAAVILAGGAADYAVRNFKDVRRTGALFLSASALFAVSLPPFLPLSNAELMRGDAEFWANLASAYENKAQPDRALWAVEEAIRLTPDNYLRYEKKTELLEDLSADADVLLDWLRHAARRFPDEYSAHMMLAEASALAGREDEALQSYRRALELAPGSVEVHLQLGALLDRMGRHGEAKRVLLEGLSLSPEDLKLQYNCAVACFVLGEREEALRRLKDVTAKDPDFGKAHRLIEQLERKEQ